MVAVQCKLCPVCSGTGTNDPANALPKKRKEFICEHCQGQRYVPLVTCRGCGRAAIEWDAEVPYCGRKKCWDELVEVIDLEKKPRGYFPFPLHTSDRRRFTAANGQIWDSVLKEYRDSIDLVQRTPTQEEIARAMAFGWCADMDMYD